MAESSYPRQWTDTLNRIRSAGGTDAVIAGGAVRDFLLGRDVKDIDVFLRSRGEAEDERIVNAALSGAALQHKMRAPQYRLQMPELSTVWDVPGDDDEVLFLRERLPVQVIFQTGPDVSLPGLLERFDFGLCRVGFDGTLVVTEEFVADAFGMTMTLLNPVRPEQSEERYRRLSAKYPYHRLVTPAAKKEET